MQDAVRNSNVHLYLPYRNEVGRFQYRLRLS